jgi:hypothetical protein
MTGFFSMILMISVLPFFPILCGYLSWHVTSGGAAEWEELDGREYSVEAGQGLENAVQLA